METAIAIPRACGFGSVSPKSKSDAATRLRRMHDRLLAAYGPQGWWPAETPFEVVVGAYLTQNTSWKAVERSLGNLRNAGIVSFAALSAVPLARLQVFIRPSGFITRKAPALKAFVAMLDEDFGGSLETMAALPTERLRLRLLELPGVGPETADAILLYALGHPISVADEYLRRIAERHGLIAPPPTPGRRTYDALVQLTTTAFARDSAKAHLDLYREFHALVVAVGKVHCRKVARCEGCPLAEDLAHSSGVHCSAHP